MFHRGPERSITNKCFWQLLSLRFFWFWFYHTARDFSFLQNQNVKAQSVSRGKMFLQQHKQMFISQYETSEGESAHVYFKDQDKKRCGGNRKQWEGRLGCACLPSFLPFSSLSSFFYPFLLIFSNFFCNIISSHSSPCYSVFFYISVIIP